MLAFAAPSAPAFDPRCCEAFGTPGQIAMAPDGRSLYVGDASSTLAIRRNRETGKLRLIDSYPNGGTTLSLSPDGRHLYVLQRGSFTSAVNAYERDPASGALTYVGRWRQLHGGQLRDLEFRDDRTLYLTDNWRDALVVLGRDPNTGALSYRGELRSGPGVAGLSGADAIALSPDGDWLYTTADGSAQDLGAFRLDATGAPLAAPEVVCDCLAWRDLEMAPGGRRLVSDGYVFDRDPVTGRIDETSSLPGLEPEGWLPDGGLLFTPDGLSLFLAATGSNQIIQYDNLAGGLKLRRRYSEGRDGDGIARAMGLALSPDGDFLYASAGVTTDDGDPTTVAAFRRTGPHGELEFSSLFRGPYFDGRPHELQGDAPELAINDGDEYTNDPTVRLRISGLSHAEWELEISNDGGFRDSVVRPTHDEDDYRYEWQLASSGPERLAKTVYVRLHGGHYAGMTFADDIVLDERPPTVVSARASTRVKLRAHDNLSGVARMQVTRHRHGKLRWRKFSRTSSLPAGHGRIYVRVRDRAGNRSHWRAVKRGGS